ncbi:MAG: glutamate-5-semialdehyde dehydrogenase [Sphaerochaetaceae bacterium]|jgi:glutamate-5-semialdehyde dehydrogenase|nr:glutamate-5-semialdehyde dehydrogenase [Sphaerochaetaceae bacterium]MDX9808724.1 glutamate-5-semialdehyde dehydrogenase [Sphaerochaetaceae bacterium]NLV84438.1 glutamate-5-semialdehyde dehydrogenase [Spirochaetales bacterium]
MNNLELRTRIAEAKRTQRLLERTSRSQRNQMVHAIAEHLKSSAPAIVKANTEDLLQAQHMQLATPLVKRLRYDERKIEESCEQLVQVASLEDPIGEVLERKLLDNELILERVSVPLGVIAMVFEARPDALVQIIALALKSGNAIVLKGGREALNTNRELIRVIGEALDSFPTGSSWIVHLESREDVAQILELDDMINLVIPRGSNSFVRYIMDHTKIPVLGHADGLCSIYIDAECDVDKAVSIAVDAKCQYPAVCNAVETILIHQDSASRVLPGLKQSLDAYQVIIHGDSAVSNIIACVAATDADWDCEYLGYEVALKVVSSLDEAIDHIETHGSKHTDAIVTENRDTAMSFLRRVDSANVFWNCSTRFSDGFRYGLGAEVGVSTQKIHARGPVGLAGLMTYKWIMAGNGHLVASYVGMDSKPFIHRKLSVDHSSSMIEGGQP